ncbi:MAG: tRNA (adenosine(37)-N6)-threonylcarbamoyltransferase complex ATPase subunit type 1 TsaE [Patescibacteria group bacterium]|nr:tRNA (adenosine(37)-N6)-threonylcarbamoyltransferase complex ATPase subunit type 1 TsaE [Patescibacteria group bacterium]
MLSHSPSQTKTIAKKLASQLKPGAVLALVGDLGAGKTHFVKGLAEYFGIKKNITSPTFVLLKIYPITKVYPERAERAEGSRNRNKIKKLIHLDCYRLSHPDELLAIGFREFLQDKNCLVVIEWADKIKTLLPKNTTWLKFSLGQKENERKIEIKK